jgi:Glycosyltransferase sugar-binding region containing DXD motif
VSAEATAVWSYWEDVPGSSRAAYLDLCLETIRSHAHPLELRLLGPDDASTWLPDLDVERWEHLPAPNYRSDYIRSRVLQRHGGIWIDVDTVALSSLSSLLSELDGSGIVCFGRELGRFFGGLCAAAPGSAFVDAWVEEQDRALSTHHDWSLLPYAALAQDVTWSLARRLPWKALPMERVAPIPWYQWRRFLSRVESPRRLLAPRPVTVVLWNAVMASALSRQTREELLTSRMLLSRLLRIGLGMSSVTGEEDGWTRLHSFSSARFSLPGQRVETTTRRVLRGWRRSLATARG